MNKTEEVGMDVFKALGYTVVKPAWPDLLAFKESSKEAIFIEVKGQGDRLSRNQRQTFDILNKLGFDVRVILINTQAGTYKINQSLTENLLPSKKREKKGAWDDFLKTSPKPYIPKKDLFRVSEEGS